MLNPALLSLPLDSKTFLEGPSGAGKIMKTLSKITLLSLLLLTLSTCTAPPEVTPDLQITLKRDPCFGTCPAYIVTIDSKGNVVYVGMQFVAVEGTQTTTIREEQLLALAAAFKEANFLSLNTATKPAAPI